MPKISQARMEERVGLVEGAALSLFRRKGFHGVGLREIAEAAGVSIGNIYNHFDGKEAIFERLLARLYGDFANRNEPLAAYLAQSRFPDDLEDMGKAIGHMVDAHRDYLTLIYVDVAEFEGRHVRGHYEGLSQRFSVVLAGRFEELRRRPGWPRDLDPAVAFTAAYMQFFNYFIVERLIGAKSHLGLPERKAVEAISLLFRGGIGGHGQAPAH